ncbi:MULTISPECIES: rhodanese-like domain-containing protein [Chelativorans]|jgi:rhodanese-related sulfurtransferase|uniref:Rhodanese-like protein n=1 Tax=Chelativorans sp. (strain BNC1) TaxID=266779 RepID=Q11FA4_CHESB|nr:MULTISPECIES: rhodanese-like domain-containing protein [Chelativorans]
MPKGYKEMLAEADAVVKSVSVEEMAAQHGSDEFVLVDIRDPRELERDGMIPSAFHAPRGMLEFWIDPESPYHKPKFAEGKTYVFYCASGWRSLLAARLAMEMGIDARSLRGGFGDWKRAGYPVAQKTKQG